MKIGEFSKLGQVSINTLRYIDELGLLRPMEIDRLTGYHYYSVRQLPRLKRILVLIDLGLSREVISQILDEGVSLEELRGMLRLKYVESQQKIADEQIHLGRAEARLSVIAMESTTPKYEVVIKQVEPQLVASVRDTLPSYLAVSRLFDEVNEYLSSSGIDGLNTIREAIWHDNEHKAGDIDGEAVVFLNQAIPEAGRVKVYELPAVTVASLVHHGNYNMLIHAYQSIGRWIEVSNYKITGPNREVYLYCLLPLSEDNDSSVIEIQFPVEKI